MDEPKPLRISQQDAVDLLRKWTQENRVIHLSLTDHNGVLVKVAGRIDRVDDIVHFSQAKSTSPLGSYTFVSFPLSDCAFEYSHAEHAPESLKQKLAGYDALLYVYRGGVGLGFAVLPPLDEWAKF